jgi:NADPH:quinone reductase-like Zn-dependent oxidoreductase
VSPAAGCVRAAVVAARGGRENLEFGWPPVPEPPPGLIRVRVLARRLNMLDVFVRHGMPGVHAEPPHIPGSGVAGTIDALRDETQGPLPGARVLLDFLVGRKALSERRVVGKLMVVPDGC